MAKRKGLKKSGIDKLEKIMLENRKYYSQNARFAERGHACGTEMCAAGFCLLLKVGKKEFDRQVASDDLFGPCTKAGIELLGITRAFNMYFPVPIFNFVRQWPPDLRDKYAATKTPMGRVRFYIKMLRTRALADGSLTEKP